MSKSEFINSASEDRINGIEEWWMMINSDDEYLPDFTKLQPYMCKPCVSKDSVKENCPGKISSDLEEDNSRIGNTLRCFLLVKTNQWLLMQKAFATWINMKFVKVILSFVFEIFLFSHSLVRRKQKLSCGSFLFSLNNFW